MFFLKDKRVDKLRRAVLDLERLMDRSYLKTSYLIEMLDKRLMNLEGQFLSPDLAREQMKLRSDAYDVLRKCGD